MKGVIWASLKPSGKANIRLEAYQVEAIASRLEAITIRLEAIAIR